MAGKKNFNFSLRLKNRKEGEKQLKKQVKKELTIVFENDEEGLKIIWKRLRDEHPLQHWDESMFGEGGMRVLLELPEAKQKKITDKYDSKKEKQARKNTKKEGIKKSTEKTK